MAFLEGTRHHDVEQNIEALLCHIQAPSPFTLLDFGCGPGRDLKALSQRAYGGCEAWLASVWRREEGP